MPRDVIIHGKRITEHSPRHGRPDFDLWGVTRCNAKFWNGSLTDWTEWFDLHPLVRSGGFEGIRERRYIGWDWMLRQDGTRPIWLQGAQYHDADIHEAQRRFDMVPGAREFPARELQAFFEHEGVEETWFTDQVGWMMAFALMRGYREIVLNGIGMQPSVQSQHAHRSTLYWMAFARGAGVKVHVEGNSTWRNPSRVYCFVRGVALPRPWTVGEFQGPEARDIPPPDSVEDANARQVRRGRPPFTR